MSIFTVLPMIRRVLLLPSLLLALLSLLLCATASAEAASSWWHLVARTSPSQLQPGLAADEVQQLTVTPRQTKEFSVETTGIGMYGRQASTRSATLQPGESAAQVQEAFEGMYGAGNVQVSGGPPSESYEIEFVGELADTPVARVKIPYESTAVNPSVYTKVLIPGRTDGEIVLTATNLGDADADPPVSVSDALPAGVEAVAIEGTVDESISHWYFNGPPLGCSLVSVSCTFTGHLPPIPTHYYEEEYPLFVPPYETIEVRIAVNFKPGAKSGEENVARVSGGAPGLSTRRPLVFGAGATPFGVSVYEARPEREGGGLDTQAGSHPFQVTTTLDLNETFAHAPAGGMAKDLHFKLPPGLVGNPTPFAHCTLAQFLALRTNASSGVAEGDECPVGTVVGVARVYVVYNGGARPEGLQLVQPLYNLEPAYGEPARFGFLVNDETPVLLDTAVRAGGDYGVTIDVNNISQEVEFLSSEVTFWGVPGAAAHNNDRGYECLEREYEIATQELHPYACETVSQLDPPPLLSLPTSCGGSLQTVVEADSWAQRGVFSSFPVSEALPAPDGCNHLQFAPEIKVTPDGQEASEPTGLTVDVHVPQEGQLNPEGVAQSNVRDITVKLPAAVAINPSSGDGLGACSADTAAAPGVGQLGDPGDQIGFEGFAQSPLEPGVSNPDFTAYLPGSVGALANGFSEALQSGQNFCPDASKIAEATIKTPLLPNPLKGFVYLAAQEANPFDSVLAMYLVAEDPISGSLVKLPGEVQLCKAAGETIAGMACETVGQLVSTFEDNPQLPFEDAELHFFGGERAPLASPSRCGTYRTEAMFTPWSGEAQAHSSSSFQITSGPNGGPCPGAQLPFSPTLTGGALSVNAGSFSPFDATFSRLPGEQNMQSIEVHLPPGLSGILTGVELCAEPQANLGECGPNSLIGETTIGVGVGGEPYTVSGGKFYLTGPYNGTGTCKVGEPGCAPFGITFVVPAKAGPFDFADTKSNHPACDCVLVRGKVEVNPITAAITIRSDPPGTPDSIPTSLEGIPLEIQHVNAVTTRNDFQFNPTNCDRMEVTGTIHSSEGSTDAVSVPFQVTNCAVLAFKPSFEVSTSGKTSRANGASLHVELTYPKAAFGTQANIRSVKVDLPEQLPSRLPTLQHACPARTFEANPASCSSESIVGHAKAVTPLIPVPLEGPAYFVSYGDAKFPELVIVLQGYGVTLDVHGETFINEKTSVTSSTFHTIPDAPVGSFELTLPQGKYSALAANTNLCNVKKLTMPTAFTAQNGIEIHESTKITVMGCAKTKKTKAKKSSKHHKGKSHGKKK
jgi:hypothetical protein